MCVAILPIDGVMLCVLVDMVNKPIGIFFTSLCSAMSFICGDVMIGGGSDMRSDSDTYSEGRPIRGLVSFDPQLGCETQSEFLPNGILIYR
jgi:hypothetical protein